MKILAIDTTGQTASAAIVDESKLIAEYTLNYKMTHSQTIMPMIAQICEDSETEPSTFDYIACSQGPGSFTGLRIGAATAKGMALALGKEIVPVPTLDALAYNIFETEKCICPIMDARRGQVYAAFYVWENGKMKRVSEMLAEPIEEIIAIAKTFAQGVIFMGDGVPVHREVLAECETFTFAPPNCSMQKASSVAALALEMVAAGQSVPSNQFEPIYLRKSQAEREREESLRGKEA